MGEYLELPLPPASPLLILVTLVTSWIFNISSAAWGHLGTISSLESIQFFRIQNGQSFSVSVKEKKRKEKKRKKKKKKHQALS